MHAGKRRPVPEPVHCCRSVAQLSVAVQGTPPLPSHLAALEAPPSFLLFRSSALYLLVSGPTTACGVLRRQDASWQDWDVEPATLQGLASSRPASSLGKGPSPTLGGAGAPAMSPAASQEGGSVPAAVAPVLAHRGSLASSFSYENVNAVSLQTLVSSSNDVLNQVRRGGVRRGWAAALAGPCEARAGSRQAFFVRVLAHVRCSWAPGPVAEGLGFMAGPHSGTFCPSSWCCILVLEAHSWPPTPCWRVGIALMHLPRSPTTLRVNSWGPGL